MSLTQVAGEVEPRRGSAIWVLARNTFREAVRDRLLTTILLFGAVLVASSVVLAPLTLGEQDRIIRDLGLTAINVFAMLLVIFVGTGLVYREIEQKTIYGILGQPISRTQFLLGKFFGLWGTVVASVCILGLVYFGMVGIFARGSPPQLAVAVALIALEGAVVTAIAILFSMVASPFLSAVFTFLVYLAGHLAADLVGLADQANEPVLATCAKVFAWLVPALHVFHVRDNILAGVPVSPVRVLWCVLMTVLYAGAALGAASLAFQRRDFE